MTGMFVKIVTSYIAQENNRKEEDSKEEIKAQNEIMDMDLNVSEIKLI